VSSLTFLFLSRVFEPGGEVIGSLTSSFVTYSEDHSHDDSQVPGSTSTIREPENFYEASENLSVNFILIKTSARKMQEELKLFR
jgi:hypothetical protein